MDINFQFVQTESNPKVTSLVYEKLENLSKKFSWIIGAEVFFKEEKGSEGKGKICEIKLSIPGPVIFASSDEAGFEAAIAETISELEKQLKTRKEKWEPHHDSNN